jgi:chromate reductase, NAD(P)H dehydrogenase (quinone)
MAVRLLAFAGALRTGSFNRKLIALAAAHATTLGAEVDLLDLREIPLPPYDGDIETGPGLPAEAKAFRERIAKANAIFISTPEYNHSIPGTLKNVIDWASRPPAQPFRGKVAGIVAASPGPYGGSRALPDLRKVLATLGVLVVPAQLALARAGDMFGPEGNLRDPGIRSSLEGVVKDVIDLATKLA